MKNRSRKFESRVLKKEKGSTNIASIQGMSNVLEATVFVY